MITGICVECVQSELRRRHGGQHCWFRCHLVQYSRPEESVLSVHWSAGTGHSGLRPHVSDRRLLGFLTRHHWLQLLNCLCHVLALWSGFHLDSGIERIDWIRFLAGCCKRQLNPAVPVFCLISSFFWVFYVLGLLWLCLLFIRLLCVLSLSSDLVVSTTYQLGWNWLRDIAIS